MAELTTLVENAVARILIVGYPGSGKTGSLACLANAGFKLRILDFDGNIEPLVRYVKPEARANVDIITLEDKLRAGPKFIEVSGLPTAFADALKALDHWMYTTKDGEEVDLGRSRDWGRDTVVVLDSLTGMGRASFRRSLAMNNRTPLNTRRQDWGLAMAEQEAFLEKLTSRRNAHHVICTAHLKMVGPKDEEKDDSEITKKVKSDAVQLVNTRLFPSALGRELPPKIAEHFPVAVLAEPKHLPQNKVKRQLHATPRPELDLKIPAELPADLPIENGLLTIFSALGCGPEECLAGGGGGDASPAPAQPEENTDE